MESILITGKNSKVGHELPRVLALPGELIALDRAAMDLADVDATPSILDKLRPDIIVNPCTYTTVDKAETETALALTVNAITPAVMVHWTALRRALLTHDSTKHVFDGSGATPWREDDAANPQPACGLSMAGRTDRVRDKYAPSDPVYQQEIRRPRRRVSQNHATPAQRMHRIEDSCRPNRCTDFGGFGHGHHRATDPDLSSRRQARPFRRLPASTVMRSTCRTSRQTRPPSNVDARCLTRHPD
ncbi:hypothetical protein HNO92_000368 [Chromobacterium alkanivorans]|nr:sugar nucleotide-binding protein [Chromobacterium alkanivorans]MCS3802718.1 hypothetical protein [Chromobacterium alkanivorans]MCS3817044.1 hypothetical protein [Chromobacterium alkanivorans]MCS3872084.1 hypothetical protein [Chromobacterium alkanivorans]